MEDKTEPTATRRRTRKPKEDAPNPLHETRKRTARASSKKGVRTHKKYYFIERDKLILVQEKYHPDPEKGGKDAMRRHRTFVCKASKDMDLIDKLRDKGLLRATEDVRLELRDKKRKNAEAEAELEKELNDFDLD